ncbi:MAG: sigma 54-interacting transcriptional regulator [Desulfobacterales bacterium]|nr:sigma 54-interacting transcriptional regulator [Desulfobacterales bacterium]
MSSKHDLLRKKTKLKHDLLNNIDNQLKCLMANLPCSIFFCLPDEDHTDLFLSDGTYDLTGYKPSELLNRSDLSFKKLMLEDYGSRIEDDLKIKKAIADKSTYQAVYRIKTKSGKIKWVYEQGKGIYSEGEEAIAMVGFVSDLTVQKQSELALKKENLLLRSRIKERYRFGDIIGKSPAMQKIYELILKAGITDANVMIFGETGTGKELVARAIHDAGTRSKHPYIPVNCSAITEGLIESEFFGHKKGAFTGAHSDKKGFLSQADIGTLFLDEVGDIGLSMQTKLLRAIEDGSYMPVGDSIVRKSDFRIISATNKNIESLVHDGKMRQDFYYRISVIPITLPPLRERKEDIPLIIEEMLEREESGRSVWQLLSKQMDLLLDYDWPGNVRELKNVINRIKVEGSLDFMKNAPFNFKQMDDSSIDAKYDPEKMGYKNMLDAIEKKILLRTLKKTNWNKSRTASLLKISRTVLSGRIDRLKLKKYYKNDLNG